MTNVGLLREITNLRDRDDSVYVFTVERGTVTLDHAESATPGDAHTRLEHQGRALRYLDFFRAVAAGAPAISCAFAMSMHDMPDARSPLPLFAFQKLAGGRSLLVPDIDALANQFYETEPDDSLTYEQKRPTAIFVGATTGDLHTVESVDSLRNERLRLGVFYRGNPLVDFRLPLILQCADADAQARIQGLGFGDGGLNWSQQLSFKFLLSVDGNGATCSRVARALKSNSALMKVHSLHVLHYFKGLQAFRHYLPVYDPEEASDFVRAEQSRPGLFEDVAAEGTTFFKRYLSRDACIFYTQCVLDLYASMFGFSASSPELHHDVPVTPPEPPNPDGCVPGMPAEGIALCHIADIGDVRYSLSGWLGHPGTGRALEALQIEEWRSIDINELRWLVYDDLDSEGSHPPTRITSGALFGQRGEGFRIYGLQLFTVGADQSTSGVNFLLECAFIDDSRIVRSQAGAACLSPNGRALEAIRIRIL